MTESEPKFPPQRQEQPGIEAKMEPQPDSGEKTYRGSERLKGKTALITGGDSGIGRAVAIAFAREGADVAFAYLKEDQDARKTRELVEHEGVRCLALKGDVADEAFCRESSKRPWQGWASSTSWSTTPPNST